MFLPSFCFVGALYVAWVFFYVGLFSVRTFFFFFFISCLLLGMAHQYYTPTTPEVLIELLTIATNLNFLTLDQDLDVITPARQLSDAASAVTRGGVEASWDPIYRTVVGKLAEVAKIQDTTTADDNKTIIFSPTILAFVLELSTHSLDNHYTKQDLGEVVNFLNTYARYKYRETTLLGAVVRQANGTAANVMTNRRMNPKAPASSSNPSNLPHRGHVRR
jgi:hypothetical protein